MTELLSFFQSYFVNQAFLTTLLLITINKIWRKVDIKIPIQIIRYVLILSGLIACTQLIYYLFYELESKNNSLNFINRATGSYKVFYIFMLFSSTLLPILLFIKFLGSKKIHYFAYQFSN